ncbi:site-specific integrase [Saccharothrix sp. NRRL B-16348]|uniref:site-specific integrase n=1 Tax=Saccharothrix sp. NRRL B-16348 TaxID=1415542 RepID=UPI0006AE26E8|nr:site-specific integrase [Saccharothrix sp. NRRL B-16348]
MVEVDRTRGTTGGRADPDAVRVALQLLDQLNLTPTDLVDVVAARRMPTFAELVPKAIEAMPEGSRRTYRTYLNKLLEVWGPRRLDEFDAEEARRFLTYTQETAQVRRTGTGGGGAAQHARRALSWLYRYAEEHEFISSRQNVIKLIPTPPSSQSRRHALSPQLVADILAAARGTGVDPTLDALILRFHLETAARTGGALALRVRDLNPDQSLVRLHEKNSMQRWQPVSPTLMEHLLHHARDRGARDEDDGVLRYADGTALARPHYEKLWRRVGRYVESVRVLGVSTHWLRHTTLTWVERNFGYAVARAYAGHAVPKFNLHGVTQVYVKAGIEEVATALQAMTGERHPLASTVTGDGSSPVTEPDRAGHGGLGRSTLPEWLRAGGVVETVQDRLVERIRQLYEEAEQAGRPRPGRGVLVKATGASDHRVIAAQAEINGTIKPPWLDDLVERIRRLYEEAEQAGRQRPSRGTLAKATGASVYRVNVAQAEIKATVKPPWMEDLVERIRRLYEEAEQAGRPRPGQRPLIKATGASNSRVRAAVAEIDRTARGLGPATPGPGVAAEASEAPLVAMTARDGHGRWR